MCKGGYKKNMTNIAETKNSDNASMLEINFGPQHPSTHGVFEEAIGEICDLVHAAGGQPQQQPGALYGRVESIEPMQAPVNSPGILGTIIGGVAGGVLGHQVGGGTGNTVATIGGAALGALAWTCLEETLSQITPHWHLPMGGLVIAIVLLAPRGLAPLFAWRGNAPLGAADAPEAPAAR